MNENINLAEILKDCPRRTKLYSPLYGVVELISTTTISEKDDPKIAVETLGEYNRTWLWFRSDGKQSMSNLPGDSYWSDECMIFPSKDQRDWSKFKASIKRFDPKTFQPFDKVLTRDELVWVANLFSGLVVRHEGKKEMVMATGVGNVYSWPQCVPYNADTMHLLGTTDEAPEYYKWWEK